MGGPSSEAGKVSVVLPVKNVAAIIRPCLDSLRWADEVLLVDGQSTDETLKIAAEFPNARAIQHPSKDIRVIVQESQSLAAHPWIFWFCADEVCTPELGAEIKSRVAEAPPDVHYFMVPSRTKQFGVDCGAGETFPRLWRKGTAKFALRRMHEMPDFDGKAEDLLHFYWHVNNPNIRTIIPKFLRYEYIDAQKATDADCARINTSFYYQLARFNYYAFRVFWPHRKKGAAATLLAMTYGIGQSIRHLMLIDELRIRKGETIRDTHGWD
jgi:glycosyltransferase involved in cell wall biosynthesis